MQRKRYPEFDIHNDVVWNRSTSMSWTKFPLDSCELDIIVKLFSCSREPEDVITVGWFSTIFRWRLDGLDEVLHII